MLSNTLKLNFNHLTIIHIFHTGYHPKIRDIIRNKQKKQLSIYSCAYTTNHNGNEDETEKGDHIDTVKIDLGLNIDT